MKILVTGANGFLGQWLVPTLLDQGFSVIASGLGGCRLSCISHPLFSYESMDFTQAPAVEQVFEKQAPDYIIHAGAMSKPDACELEKETAYLVNVTGTRNLLKAAESAASFFIHLSTDFIFSGETGMYREEDLPGPVNYYGQTKWEAEREVQQYRAGFCIIRTVLVYGPNRSGRKNFVELVRDKLEAAELFRVVDDQIRTPTFVGDLAGAILAVIKRKAVGIYHVSGAEILTPFEMAVRTADFLGLDKTRLQKVNATTLVEPARRPLKTGFIISKARDELDFRPISFSEGLRKTFSK